MSLSSLGRAGSRTRALPSLRRRAAHRLCAALFLLPVAASAQGSPTVDPSGGCNPFGSTTPYFAVLVNGADCYNLSSYLAPGSLPHQWSTNTEVELTRGGENPFARLSFDLTYDADPFLSFGTSTTNLVAGPTTYAFLFGTPIVPGFYTFATSTGGVTVTNGLGGTTTVDNSVVYPTYISGYGTVGLVPTNLGVDLGTAPCVSGPAAPFTVTNVCNQGTTSNTFAPTFYDNLEALLTYTQNDIGSVASWSGAVTLNESVIPEPGTVVLMATGLLAIGAAARRRRTG